MIICLISERQLQIDPGMMDRQTVKTIVPLFSIKGADRARLGSVKQSRSVMFSPCAARRPEKEAGKA